MATPRAVRIPRRPAGTLSGQLPSSEPSPAPSLGSVPAPHLDRRNNRAGTQRAFRLASIYLVTLAVLYVSFVLIDRMGPGGTGSTATTSLLTFTLFAVALAIGGVWVALGPAPRAIEISPLSVVIVEWWGRRRDFGPLNDLTVHVVRRFPASFLSSDAVETVEIGGRRGARRTYQIEEGLLEEQRPVPSTVEG